MGLPAEKDEIPVTGMWDNCAHMQAYTDSILESIWTQNHIHCTHDAI